MSVPGDVLIVVYDPQVLMSRTPPTVGRPPWLISITYCPYSAGAPPPALHVGFARYALRPAVEPENAPDVPLKLTKYAPYEPRAAAHAAPVGLLYGAGVAAGAGATYVYENPIDPVLPP